MRSKSNTRSEGANVESRIEELEVDLRIANARAELAIKLVSYLCDELGRSGVISWGADDLKRQFLTDTDMDVDDHPVEFARLDIEPGAVESDMAEAVDEVIAYNRAAARLRKAILEQIRHERSSPS